MMACLFVSCQLVKGAMPSLETIGQLLGFSPSELLIEDITAQERTVMNAPSVRDQRRQAVLPDPAGLLKAYIIRGKNADAFFPIQVYIGARGTFLTSEVFDELARSDSLPPKHRIAGTEEFAVIGRGGMYFTKHFKVKADRPPMNLPSLVVANITVVQPHGYEFDVKIAQRLDQELQPIAGGEAYYNTFGPSIDKTAEAKARQDGSKIFLELNKVVIAEWQAEKGSNGDVQPTQQLATQQATPSKQPVVAPQAEPPSTSSSAVWMWWLGGLALVVLTFIANAFRKRRH